MVGLDEEPKFWDWVAPFTRFRVEVSGGLRDLAMPMTLERPTPRLAKDVPIAC